MLNEEPSSQETEADLALQELENVRQTLLLDGLPHMVVCVISCTKCGRENLDPDLPLQRWWPLEYLDPEDAIEGCTIPDVAWTWLILNVPCLLCTMKEKTVS